MPNPIHPQHLSPRERRRQVCAILAHGVIHTALHQLNPTWDELFPAEKARIVALLVERIDIGTDGLNVQLRVDGLVGLARETLADNLDRAA
ncbi:hypothetical protein [Acuticoccus sp. I52.16.1]|uniref:hypothetical protein n=1 Tax=Acuticoccus sp. I52.16.1 TaxID=2928472 RepID=UPI001FD43BD6|nr:hypothetical protein [Acuticoccus sp. I52.16.1]UOM36718.1 hypothetical protein MRB58_11230 [Acuticoccus sp. I52.16.1]